MKKFVAITVSALFLLSACGSQQNANEVVVPFDSVPVAVQKTITKKAAGRKIEQVEKETDGKKVTYEAKLVDKKGVVQVIHVCEDGKLVKGKKHAAAKAAAPAKEAAKAPAAKAKAAAPEAKKNKVSSGAEVAWDKIPAEAQKSIARRAGGQKVDKVEEVSVDGNPVYVARVTKPNGTKLIIKVAHDGKTVR